MVEVPVGGRCVRRLFPAQAEASALLQSPRHKMGCAHGLCLVVSGPRAEERCQGDNKCNDHHLEGENGPESKEVKLMCGV